MKKLFVLLTLAGMLSFVMNNEARADEHSMPQTEAEQEEATQADDPEPQPEPTDLDDLAEETEIDEDVAFHYVLKEQFMEGGPEFMSIVLICLILGLGLSLERIIYLNLASTNAKKLLNKVEEALNEGGVEQAKEVCRNTRGPVASIFYQGLDRYEEGLEIVEKSLVSYGSVMTGRLEMNLTWIALFIAIAPMLGFMGTVIGMIGAFDAIAAAGDISPTVVADGIKVALLTTAFGLIVGVILQIFYNYIVSKIDGIVNTMEDATISFMDILIKYKK